MTPVKCVRFGDRTGLAGCHLVAKNTDGFGADVWLVLLGRI